jgi:hypothetical protein
VAEVGARFEGEALRPTCSLDDTTVGVTSLIVFAGVATPMSIEVTGAATLVVEAERGVASEMLASEDWASIGIDSVTPTEAAGEVCSRVSRGLLFPLRTPSINCAAEATATGRPLLSLICAGNIVTGTSPPTVPGTKVGRLESGCDGMGSSARRLRFLDLTGGVETPRARRIS